jgi:hypothetical protein
MIINKIKKDGVTTANYDSSNILASKWDGKDLTVIFKHGGSYTYNGVTNTDYTRFELAESQGAILNTKIKAYSFTKNDNVDVNKIIKEIEEFKDLTLIKFEEGIIEQMRLILSAYETSPKLNKISLDMLVEMLIKHTELSGQKSNIKLCACD